jgi:hypothetical protein
LEQRVIEYLLSPIQRAGNESLRERQGQLSKNSIVCSTQLSQQSEEINNSEFE